MRRRILLLLALQMLPALWFCRDFVFRGELLLSEEVLDMNYAWEKRLDAVGWRLEEALWDRNSFCGFPFLANPATRSLYPPSLIFRLLTPLSPESSFGWLILLHLWILGAGGAIWINSKFGSLASAALGGWIWSASGYVVARTGEADPGFLFAVAWIPWILHGFDRLNRPFAVPTLAGLGFLEVTSGRSDMTFFTAYLAGGLLAFRWVKNALAGAGTASLWTEELAKVLGVSVVAILLCAPQILPTLELQKQSSNRSGEADFEFASTDSMYPPQFLLSLIPGCLGDSTETVTPGWVTQRWKFWGKGSGFHEVYFYFGQATLLLALLGLFGGKGPERFFWTGVACLAFLLAMGRYFPLFEFFFDWVPGWSRFRVPPRVLLAAIPAVSYLAASGLNQVARDVIPQRKLVTVCGAALLGMALLCAGLMVFAHGFMNHYLVYSDGERMLELPPSDLAIVTRNAAGSFREACTWTLVNVSLSAGLLLASSARRLGPRAAGWGLAIFVLLDLCVANGGFMRGVSHKEFAANFPEDPLIAAHLAPSDGGRIVVLGYVLQYERRDTHPWFFPGRLLAYDVPMAQGYAPLLLSDYVRAFEAIDPTQPTNNKGLLLYLFHTQSIVPEVFQWFDVSTLLAPEPLPAPFEELKEKVYVGKRGFTSRLRLYRNPIRHPRTFLFDSEPDSEFPSPNVALGTAEITAARPDSVTVRVNAKRDCRLALLETWYPGWKCHLDGEEAEVEKVAQTFRSVAVTAGTHEAVFEYRPDSWRRGVQLFWTGLVIWGMGVGESFRRVTRSDRWFSAAADRRS